MKRSPAKTKKQQDYVESRDSQKSSSGIKLAKLPKKLSLHQHFGWMKYLETMLRRCLKTVHR